MFASHRVCKISKFNLKVKKLGKAVCSAHVKELELFCKDCCKAICSVCFCKDHIDHSITSAAAAAIENEKLVTDLKEKVITIAQTKVHLKAEADRIEKRSSALLDEVEARCEMIIKAVAARKQNIFSQVKFNTGFALTQLQAFEAGLDTLSSRIFDSVIDFEATGDVTEVKHLCKKTKLDNDVQYSRNLMLENRDEVNVSANISSLIEISADF
jgi:hypothetical protein